LFWEEFKRLTVLYFDIMYNIRDIKSQILSKLSNFKYPIMHTKLLPILETTLEGGIELHFVYLPRAENNYFDLTSKVTQEGILKYDVSIEIIREGINASTKTFLVPLNKVYEVNKIAEKLKIHFSPLQDDGAGLKGYFRDIIGFKGADPKILEKLFSDFPRRNLLPLGEAVEQVVKDLEIFHDALDKVDSL